MFAIACVKGIYRSLASCGCLRNGFKLDVEDFALARLQPDEWRRRISRVRVHPPLVAVNPGYDHHVAVRWDDKEVPAFDIPKDLSSRLTVDPCVLQISVMKRLSSVLVRDRRHYHGLFAMELHGNAGVRIVLTDSDALSGGLIFD